jgi:drug/metabolite transporter (DMT)-like permease
MHLLYRHQEVFSIFLHNKKNQAILAMFICAVLWSSAGIFIKLIPWNPLAIAGLRSLISAGVFLLFMYQQKLRFKLNRYSVLCGVFLSGTFFSFIVANKLTTSANAIVLQYTAPIFILILSAIIFKQKFRLGDILTVTATTIGISLFFLDQLSGGYLIGNLVAITAGLFFASMFITTGRADETSRMSGILLGHVFTAIIGVPFAFILPTPFTTVSVLSIVALGIFQLGIPYILYGIAVRHISPLTCSLISAFEPLLNPFWVFLFNGEAPGFFALIGGVVVVSSIITWTIWSSKSSMSSASGRPTSAVIPVNQVNPIGSDNSFDQD